ncbi:MAG: NAD-dependent deacylase, partial [Bacteroidia bacterium]|nr:NAD-dependent deacylase [Bacteroidia bacterium]
EKDFDVQIITQNVDDLHERAGSKNIWHLHGEIVKSRSTKYDQLVYSINGEYLNMGDVCEFGSQLRPHIVWFGEAVPAIEKAIEFVEAADILVIIGTSLQVYPAAGLYSYFSPDNPIILVDPKPQISYMKNLHIIAKNAVEGIKDLSNKLYELY